MFAKHLMIVCVVVFMLAALPLVSLGQDAELMEVDLLLPYIPYMGFYTSMLADELGYFEEEGMDVNIQGTDGSTFVVQKVAAGYSEFGVASTEPVVLGNETNQDYTAVYEYLTKPLFSLYVLPDSGIETFADLAGKVVGVSDLVGGEALIGRLLAGQAGLTLGIDLELRAVGYDQAMILEQFSSSELGAIISAAQTVARGELLGVEFKCIVYCGDTPASSEVIITSNAFMAEYPELVEGMAAPTPKPLNLRLPTRLL